MAKLPYSRVVNVTLSRKDSFPSRRGFGTPIFITNATKAGVVDATTPVKVYGSIEEVAGDWLATDEFYKAAELAFSQNPRPVQIKVGHVPYVLSGTPTTKEGLKTLLSTLSSFDDEWYWLGVDKNLRDLAVLDGVVEWVEARTKLAILDSNAVGTEDPSNTTTIAARHKGTVERTAIFYHTDADVYASFALAASLGTRNFDESNSAYTAKFKRLRGVNPINKGSAAVQAITGFTPALGQSAAAGHMANTYVDIGGQTFVVEGSTLTPNVFIDEIHASDWIVARTEEEVLGILLNNNRVPYTDVGMEQLASGARTVMRSADRAGLIANDLDPETGLYAPAVEYTIPSVFDVPASQRAARIAPDIRVRFRYAGAVHYTTIHYSMTF